MLVHCWIPRWHITNISCLRCRECPFRFVLYHLWIIFSEGRMARSHESGRVCRELVQISNCTRVTRRERNSESYHHHQAPHNIQQQCQSHSHLNISFFAIISFRQRRQQSGALFHCLHQFSLPSFSLTGRRIFLYILLLPYFTLARYSSVFVLKIIIKIIFDLEIMSHVTWLRQWDWRAWEVRGWILNEIHDLIIYNPKSEIWKTIFWSMHFSPFVPSGNISPSSINVFFIKR